MPETTPPRGGPPATEPVNPEVRHERSDANVRVILGFGVGLVVVAVVVHFLLTWMSHRLERREEQKDPPRTLVEQERPQLPRDVSRIPGPRLQESSVEELRQFRAAEKARLEGSGVVDAEKDLVRIPIDLALRMLADPKTAEAHGLRSRPQQQGGPKEKARQGGGPAREPDGKGVGQ